MSLSADTVTRLMVATAKPAAGNELASAVNNGAALAAQCSHSVAAFIVAAHTSQTTDFGALLVGDVVVHISTAGGNNDTITCATAGTLGEAAVVGDIYMVLRPYAAPAASAAHF